MKLLFGGSPCQPFSILQKTAKRETKPNSGIGWELFDCFERVKEEFRPQHFLYENVASMASEIKEEITKVLGVEPVMINSSLVSAQSRKRLYWTDIPIGQPEDRGLTIESVLGKGIYIGKIVGRKSGNGLSQRLETHEGLNGKSGALTTVAKDNVVLEPDNFGDAQAVEGRIYWKGNWAKTSLPDGFYKVRNLSVEECMKLQTIPDWFKFPDSVKKTNRYRLIGNGWTNEAIKHIIRQWGLDRSEHLDIVSMFDGIGGAHIALRDLGFGNIARYRATEIDKWAIQTAQHNFPGIIQMGDAREFHIRRAA